MKRGNFLLRLVAAAETLIIIAAGITGCGKNGNQTQTQADGEEYFTVNGQISRSAALFNAVQINDFLYYVEEYAYNEELSNGKTVERKGERIVRLNLKTGNVSSACVDPVCTHVYGSGCPMNKDYLNDTGNIYNLRAVGDWLFYCLSECYYPDDYDHQKGGKVDTLINYMIYNTITGEVRELFPRNSIGESGVAPAVLCGTVHGNIIFTTLPEFVKDENGEESLVYVLRSYDADKDKTTVIYTNPKSFNATAVTNKRIYIGFPEGTELDTYSMDRDGQDMRPEDGFYAPIVTYGTLAYYYRDAGRRYAWLYDLTTHTSKELDTDELAGGFCISKDKLYYLHITSEDEYALLDMKKLYEKYDDLDVTEKQKAISREYNSILYGGVAQLYSADLDGGSPQLLFEYDHMIIRCAAAAGNYLYAYISSAQPPEYTVNSTANNGFSRIDLTTGEITPVPLLGAG